MGDKIELSYLAGFLDGEGCIMLPRVKNKRKHVTQRLAVVVDNTNNAAIKRFAIRFGGSIITIKPRRHNQRGHFRWTVSDIRAETVVKTLLPYLRVKRKQAEVALEFRKTVSRSWTSNSVPDYIIEKRNELSEQMHKLNARGAGVPLVED